MYDGKEREVRVSIGGVEIAFERRGKGSPLLLLYGEEALELEAPAVEELARGYELIIPSPPGFGTSERPDWITSPDDIAYLYLDLAERLGLNKVPVVAFSFGGWIAAEMATKDCSFISKLVLVSPYGIKVGGPFDRDIQDIWLLHPDKVMGLKWFDKAKGKRDYASMPDDKLIIIARNNESFARFAWEPYMHNPKLKHRLGRIKAPTLLVWGENDGIVTTDYGRAYQALIPGARLAVIAEAGHYPHIEQPEAFMRQVKSFLG
ncbi:MAG TPA: alpha/beta hydrolase [Hyphomicrobiaceae bacterium]|nr:alpha/beta hydrolase [Hyphomicrobiaceae bacterium]